MNSKIRDDYCSWLVNLTCNWCSLYSGRGSYHNLMSYLYFRQFTWTMLMDGNRASDGLETRFEFVEQYDEYTYRDVYLYLTQSCSVLEMMTALAKRCEDHIMGDPSQTDNTGGWFWNMITNMHLEGMTDDRFDEAYVEQVVTNMLEHNYASDGDGGLFRINDPEKDMRFVDIWCQLSWYLNEVLYDG